ncbi:EpsG family protein [Marinilactibacillus psychrotolerans]|uniref:EpsG family protein n=1 Tax=Marinilactibacillus psychrotolerans TaxID=191770 RepID=UPI003885C6B5
MTIPLFIILVGINLWLAYKKQYSKVITIITLVAILIFMAGAGPDYATENRSMDYINYERRYNNIENVGLGYNIQFGYTIIQKIGSFLGLNFFWFRFVVSAICLLALYFLVIRKYTYNANFVLSFYLLYPMIIDSEQLRNFIAMTIVLSSISLLGKSSSVYKVIYFGMIGIAGTFHTAFLFYLPLMFVTNKKSSRFAKCVAVFSLLLMVIMLINNNHLPFSEFIIETVNDRRVTRYLSSSTTLGFIMPLALTISSIILVFWAKMISDREIDIYQSTVLSNSSSNKSVVRMTYENRFVNLVFWINLLSSFFFPFFIITLQFYRLPRNLLLLNIVSYAIVINKLNKDSLHRIFFIGSVIFSMILWLFIDLVVTTSADRVLIPFFLNNYFLN